MTHAALRRRNASRRAALAAAALVQVASFALPADNALAQGSACDQFKARLASRIDPSIGPYSLEAVPADAVLPRGAKVVGTCEGGARKILLIRGGAAPPPDAAAVASPASLPQAAPAEPTRRPVEVQRSRPVAAASAPSPSARTGARPAAVTPAASASAPTVESPAASGVPAPPVDRAASGADPQADEPRTATLPWQERAVEFLGRYGAWILVPVLLAFAGALWAWLAYRRRYDASGLPRGPRLN
jgi:hypothetical protein